MKIKQLLAALSLLLISSISVNAAKKTYLNIDLNQIGVDVTMHPDQYNALLDRFVKGDTTLTMGEMATVYYGFSFTFNYAPNETYTQVKEDLDAKNYTEVLAQATEALQVDPTNLRLIAAGLVAATHTPDKSDETRAVAVNLQRRLDMLVDLIFESGSGISREKPFYVICQTDIETLIQNIIGASIVGNAMTGDIDAYKISFSGAPREHILYFNNTRQHTYDSMPR
jgi:hypothetical protein